MLKNKLYTHGNRQKILRIPLDNPPKEAFNGNIIFKKEKSMRNFNAYAYWWYGFTKPEGSVSL